MLLYLLPSIDRLKLNDGLIGSQADAERKKMFREGALKIDDGCYTLTKDYSFSTISRASQVVNGSGGARRAWVNDDGLNIGQYYYAKSHTN